MVSDMAVGRSQSTKPIPVNIAGSSTFGRYPKISIEKTINMFISDDWLVPYAGYKVVIPASLLGNGTEGRGSFTSVKFNALVIVINANVYMIRLVFDQKSHEIIVQQIIQLGSLQTTTGIVYIVENNKPQILISDGLLLYIYDQTVSSQVQIVPNLNFKPGYITFHDTYFICAASQDQTYTPVANNTWRLSLSNEGYQGPGNTNAWPSTASNVGLIETKPDVTQAVVRFPSRGNMIMVLGSTVTESWFDTGTQLFPYQRNNQFNVDYGCVSPATVAYMDELVVWLAQNEKSGPVILVSDGGTPRKITTDGIDYLLSTLQTPQDSQAFLYRQDGHLFYHINFYSDNFSLFYDFNKDKFYHASDQNLNYFIASEISFIGNQYYFVSRNTGNLYAFDTQFYTYNDQQVLVQNGEAIINYIDYEIPRIRICKSVRLPSQDYYLASDIGFTIESGQTDPYPQEVNSNNDNFLLLNGQQFSLLNGQNFVLFGTLEEFTPVVYLSVSYDGGEVFGNEWAYVLPDIGQRRNRLMWWQLGMTNDFTAKFRFQSIGRVVCTEGVLNIRAQL